MKMAVRLVSVKSSSMTTKLTTNLEVLCCIQVPLKVSVQYYTSCGDVYHAYNWEVLTFESVDEILKCDHSNESY